MNGEHLIGRVINERYELKEIIGNGGMAMVFRAEDRLLTRTVAVKILKESLKDDVDIVEKFAAEGKAAAALSHNSIVSVYDVGQIDGLGFIVMEYVDGMTLKEYINENKPIKWQTACDITIQIANALAVAHEHGIIHRDIKPHNILITKDAVAKVADFGIASAVSSETMVAGGSAIGSVHYISPEQARGGYVDTVSDLYSLGVVLYEMVTGTLPFDGDNAVSIALKKLEEEPVSPKVVNLDVPQALDAIIMKAISKEQHLRYKTANEFAEDLKNLLQEDSLHIVNVRKKDDVEETVQKKKSKGFNPIIASVILLAVIAVATFLLMSGGRKEYIVPDLLGKTLEEAEALVADTEFEIDYDGIVLEISEEESGIIINQDPGANESTKKNKKIKLTISTSEIHDGNAMVPNILGKSRDEAKAMVEAQGLIYVEREVEGTEDKLNKVISQEPYAGKEIQKGGNVFVEICTTVVVDNSPVKVPDISGLTRAEADMALQNAGLIIGTITKQQSDAEEGRVIKQDPEAQQEVIKGSAVNIVISEKTPVESTLPEVTQSPQNSIEPTQPTTPSTTEDVMKKKTLTINIPDSADDTIVVRVLANGKEIHNKTHQKSEGKVDIVVQSKNDAVVEVYMNGELVVKKVIEF